ncbi:nitrilase-related carbon-nitrogen hydrolase [Deferrisoma camini]|uniref:nitrilase-related carbon-nitrogen hydrolase n=1 Tax=Deferrisoma camini TaxID=1035120 RepID=UPI00046D8C56|nr:nitrilase-related carbon-nitrogen hydrolase [Deferrisoma camini]
MKIAAVQVVHQPEPERVRARVEQFLQAARARGAEIACLPELALHPWFPRDASADPSAHAQPASGPLAAWASEVARKIGIAVVLPFCERRAEGVYHNSALVVDAGGRVRGLYRKIHLPDIPGWAERRLFAPGDLGFPVFDLGGLKVGVQLGWDQFFPEGFRCLALAGAQVVFVPTAAAYASQERWLAMGVSHAVTNGCYLVRVNRVGSEDGLDFYGHSYVVRPDGDLAAEPLGMAEGVLLAEVDPSTVEWARRTWPFLADRRPRQYAAVAGVVWPESPRALPDPAEEEAS